MSLAASLLQAQGNPLSIRTGSVTRVSPLQVLVGGGTVQVDGRLASYTPTLGEVVLLLVDGTSMVVVGRLLPA